MIGDRGAGKGNWCPCHAVTGFWKGAKLPPLESFLQREMLIWSRPLQIFLFLSYSDSEVFQRYSTDLQRARALDSDRSTKDAAKTRRPWGQWRKGECVQCTQKLWIERIFLILLSSNSGNKQFDVQVDFGHWNMFLDLAPFHTFRFTALLGLFTQTVTQETLRIKNNLSCEFIGVVSSRFTNFSDVYVGHL